MDAGTRRRVSRGHRWHQRAAGAPDDVSDADRARLGLARHRGPHQRVRDRHAAARDGDDRRVRRARSLPVLRLLGSDADPDVFRDRGVGRRQSRLRRGEVRPLHDGRLRAHAGGHSRAVLPARRRHRRLHVRSADPHALRAGAGARPDAHVPRLRAGLCHQSAAVPVPHVAARRPRRGAHGRLGDPRRRAAQDGHVRLPAVLLTALPGRERRLRSVGVRAGRDRHRVRRARLDRAAGSQEARRLFEREPPRVRDARALHPHAAGPGGRRDPDGEPRAVHGRALPDGRDDLRAAAHAADLGVRRSLGGDPSLLGAVPDRVAVLARPARLERLRR